MSPLTPPATSGLLLLPLPGTLFPQIFVAYPSLLLFSAQMSPAQRAFPGHLITIPSLLFIFPHGPSPLDGRHFFFFLTIAGLQAGQGTSSWVLIPALFPEPGPSRHSAHG